YLIEYLEFGVRHLGNALGLLLLGGFLLIDDGVQPIANREAESGPVIDRRGEWDAITLNSVPNREAVLVLAPFGEDGGVRKGVDDPHPLGLPLDGLRNLLRDRLSPRPLLERDGVPFRQDRIPVADGGVGPESPIERAVNLHP